MKIQYLLSFISIFSTVLPGKRTSLTMEEQLMLVKVHNEKRSIVEPTASNMRKMRFSQDLADSAQDWADKCVWRHGRTNMASRKYKEPGQNLAANTRETYLKQSVVAWDNEKKDYDYSTGNCGEVCGHYTQDVWANSYLLGCGAKFCPGIVNGMDGNQLVCHYYPPGNYIGQKPYKSGASCSACPSKAPKCVSNLCVAENDSREDDSGEDDGSEDESERGGQSGGSEDDSGRGGYEQDGFGANAGYGALYWILPVSILIAVIAIILYEKDKKMKRKKRRRGSG